MDFLNDTGTMAAVMATAFAVVWGLPRLISGVPHISAKKLRKQLEEGSEVLLLDVREKNEFNGRLGHLAGALHIPLGSLRGRLESSEIASLKSVPVCVICHSGQRAVAAARLLKKSGFGQVSILAGGMARWSLFGYPVQR